MTPPQILEQNSSGDKASLDVGKTFTSRTVIIFSTNNFVSWPVRLFATLLDYDVQTFDDVDKLTLFMETLPPSSLAIVLWDVGQGSTTHSNSSLTRGLFDHVSTQFKRLSETAVQNSLFLGLSVMISLTLNERSVKNFLGDVFVLRKPVFLSKFVVFLRQILSIASRYRSGNEANGRVIYDVAPGSKGTSRTSLLSFLPSNDQPTDDMPRILIADDVRTAQLHWMWIERWHYSLWLQDFLSRSLLQKMLKKSKVVGCWTTVPCSNGKEVLEELGLATGTEGKNALLPKTRLISIPMYKLENICSCNLYFPSFFKYNYM